MIRLTFAAAFLAAFGAAAAAQAQWPNNPYQVGNPYVGAPYALTTPQPMPQMPQMPGGWNGSTVGNTTTFYGTGSNMGRNLSCTRVGQNVNCY